jgi:hypothetical protein
MVAGWLNHKQLQIVKGIGKTPGDTYSAESDPIIVNLMGGIITLEEWSPNIPAVKNGGIWVDSPLADGRQLLSAVSGNVLEHMTVLIADGSYLGTIKALSGLNQIALDCRDYWQTEGQVDPVYLAWWAGCGAGTQYALLSNIELAPEYLDSPDKPTIRVNITLEREPYWRGIPPGANPKVWSYYVNASHPQYNVNVAQLLTGTDHLISQNVYNKFSWTPAAYGLQQIALDDGGGNRIKNYIDIPGSLIPGDAPALLEVAFAGLGPNPVQIYMGLTSKKYSGIGHDGVNRAYSLILNAGDGNSAGVVTKTVATSTTGVISNGSSTVYYRGVRTVTGIDGAFVTACQWGLPATANSIQLDREFYRGTFAIFVRAYNESAASPVLTDMTMRVVIEEWDGSTVLPTKSITLPEANPPLRVVNSTADYPLTYMGTITLPLSQRSVVSSLGYGRQIKEALDNMRITLQHRVDVATANRTFNVIDLILMPIDEGMASVVGTSVTGLTDIAMVMLDNTGYLMRGQAEQKVFCFADTGGARPYFATGGSAQEMRGQNIMLKPKTDQRLHIIASYSPLVTSTALLISSQVNLNIVPRWSGIRDT